MRIRALTSFAGPRGSFDEGEERDVSDEVGREWVKAGLAEKVKQSRAKAKAELVLGGPGGSEGDELFPDEGD